MKIKKWITKIIIILIAISLLKISYGYWTEELSLKGKATLLVQVSVIDKVKKTIVKKTDETIDKKEMNENEMNENEETKKTEEDTNKDTKIEAEEGIDLTKDSSLSELDKTVNVDQKVTELKKNQKELQEGNITESSKNDTTVEMNKDTQPQEDSTEDKQLAVEQSLEITNSKPDCINLSETESKTEP